MPITDSFPDALLVLHDHRAVVVDMVAYSAALQGEPCEADWRRKVDGVL
jgi:hypothetical protein